jgi:cyclophilin family peptidyl-prolyl cis-trans isomerase
MTRPRILPGLLAALAIPVLLAACSSGGGGTATALPTIPPATPTPLATPAESPSADPMAHPTYPEGCPTAQPPALPAGETRTVTITTDKGDIVIKVTADLSPIAAGNFVALAECGYYDGVVFHRLVPSFVIQGGDGAFGRSPNVVPGSVSTGGPPYTIKDEPVTSQYKRGTIAMARTAEPDSVGSQFFIVLDDGARDALASYNTYQIIGEVTAGMDVVDTIAAMPNSGADTGNAALEPVPMTKVTVAKP